MSGNLHVNNGQIDSLNSSSIDSYDLKSRVLNVHTIKPYNADPVVTLNFAKSSNTTEISQSGISDQDFVRILRAKLRLTVDVDDPLYIQAVARMVTNDPT